MKYKRGLSSSTLKCIAILSMLIDHFAVAIYINLPEFQISIYKLCRYLGRFAFPIYCFLLVEGFLHTKDLKKYMSRILLLAVISEIPFDMVRSGKYFDLTGQNVFFTLFLGLVALSAMRRFSYYTAKNQIIKIVLIAGIACISNFAQCDYHWLGILTICLFYQVRPLKSWYRDVLEAIFLCYEIPASLAVIPIHFYNGQRGWKLKYVFYFVYPIHLFIYGMIRMKVLGA